MRLLLVAATEQEIAPLLRAMKFCGDVTPNLKWYQYKDRNIDVLITGVGMVATAAWVTRTITQRNYSCAVNVGICGSFDRNLKLGEVVRVHSDCMPELGAEDGADFISIYDMDLLSRHDFPFRNGVLEGSDAAAFGTLVQLKAVSGITVNRVHGSEDSISQIVQRHNPQVESMEGAGFYYACALGDVFAIQVRAISNYVERRNRNAWKIQEAVKNLNAELLKFLDQR